jgi:hypothetical protein
MTNSVKTISPAQLGNIALGADNHPKGATPKLESVGEDVNERFYMLAAFCFDLSRKLKYICLTLREFWDDADPEFAKRILQHNEFINPPPPDGPLPWGEMAKRAEEVMKGLWEEIRKEGFEQNLRKLAAKAS